MTEPRNDDRSRARSEAAALLGVDIDHMSPADGLRVDMISSLRLVIDSEQASVLSGGAADLGKLNVAVQSLIALLPGRELPAPESDHPDPRVKMWEIYREMRERGEVPPEGWHQHRIDAQAAEIAALKAQLVGAGLTPALSAGNPASWAEDSKEYSDSNDANAGNPATAIDPTEVVPPGEWRGERHARPGPDDPAPRSAAVIEAKANPPPAAPRNWDETDNGRKWRAWVDAGGGGSGYDRWSNRNGA